MYNFTKEFVYDLDQRVRKYDDLVRLTIKTPFKHVVKQFELEALEKIMVSEIVDEYARFQVFAQFASTNRPYNITDDIMTGFLFSYRRGAVRDMAIANNFAFDGSNNPDPILVKQAIRTEPDMFRKHDETVVDIIHDFYDAFTTTMYNATEFIKKSMFFTMGSYRSYQETNPERDSLNTPNDSIRFGTALHVYDKATKQVIKDYYQNHIGGNSSFWMRTMLHMMASSIQGDDTTRNTSIRSLKARTLNLNNHDLFLAISKGFIVHEVPYTLRDDLDPAELFTKPNKQPQHLYVMNSGKLHIVSILSLRGHQVERQALLEKVHGLRDRINDGVDLDFTFDGLPMVCRATGHYLFNANYDQTLYTPPLNNRGDLLRSVNIGPSYFDRTPVTLALEHKFKPMLDFSNSKRCARCFRASVIVEGDMDAAMAILPNEYYRTNLRQIIERAGEHNMTEHDGEILCDHCMTVRANMLENYNGYFRNDFFISPDAITSQMEIENYDHCFIQDYDYKPHDLWDMSYDMGSPSLGVELEVDSDYDDLDLDKDNIATMAQLTLAKGADHAYLMSDGSLENGFELATYPANVYQHMDPKLFDYKNMFRKVIRAGMRGHDAGSAGIHVHISRDYFSSNRSEQLYRASLMAYIMEANWEDFVRFSRRRYHHLDQWAKKKDMKYRADRSTNKSEIDYRDAFVREYDHDKYVAFNINHRHTFELRIFRSTLNYTTYLATLQLVHNFAKLAKRIDLGEAQLITFKDIVNEEQFDELNSYVKTRFGDDYLN